MKSPNSASLTRRYIDNISSECVINGATRSRARIVITKNRVEIVINTIPTNLKSFLFFKVGIINNRYVIPLYANILVDPFIKVSFILLPKIGFIPDIDMYFRNPSISINPLAIIKGTIIKFVFTIDLNPNLFAIHTPSKNNPII